ncbi:hypothetical protein GCM10007049_28830 [Echinicola pacifica]|uniref:DUF2480 family protein n=1 Tax=Echinicola pacifica TaxID=346377 RepID=A0A918Q5A9_9BACT|nr:DUF2480 family protein [Echinicola pacifica]GGZ33756.1 hypothetical protein GCM10007049_28830 [Echinicola pacifica]
MTEIINRVANSPLVTIDLEELYVPGERAVFDLKEYLFQGLVLREKDFRKALKEMSWEEYEGKLVAVTCSTDAIIPTWAYMLVVSYLEGVAKELVVGDLDGLEQALFQKALMGLDVMEYKDKPVVVKGCSKLPVPMYAYGQITRVLKGISKSIMYGEPCSTVPIYKKPKE